MEPARLTLVSVEPDLTDPFELHREFHDLAERARRAGWRVNLAADLDATVALLTFSASREG